MRMLLRLLREHRDLRLVLSAGLVSVTGDWVLRVGLAYQVYVLTGSTLASGAMLLAGLLPAVLLGSFAGVFADRWDRRRTMVATSLLRAAGLLPLLLVDGGDRIWIVYAVMVWESSLQQLFLPAERALVPALVPADKLVSANAANGQAVDVARLVGAGVGGVLGAAGGLAGLALADAGSFLVAALLLARVRSGAEPGNGDGDGVAAAGGGGGGPRAVVAQWRDGLRMAARHPVLRPYLLFWALAGLGEGVMGTLFAPFVKDVLGGGGSVYGLVLAVQAVGGIAGGLLVAAYGARWAPERMWGWGALAFGAVDLALFLYPLLVPPGAEPVLWPALVLMVLVGVPGAMAVAGSLTVAQRVAAPDERGRLFGAQAAVGAAATLMGTVGAGVLGGNLGIVPVIAVQGAVYVAGGGLVLATVAGKAGGGSGRVVRRSAARQDR